MLNFLFAFVIAMGIELGVLFADRPGLDNLRAAVGTDKPHPGPREIAKEAIADRAESEALLNLSFLASQPAWAEALKEEFESGDVIVVRRHFAESESVPAWLGWNGARPLLSFEKAELRRVLSVAGWRPPRMRALCYDPGVILLFADGSALGICTGCGRIHAYDSKEELKARADVPSRYMVSLENSEEAQGVLYRILSRKTH